MDEGSEAAALPALDASIETGAELGRGAFGVVLRGRRRADGAAVAVKLPHAAPAPDERARLLREVRLAADLDHPRLVGFVGAFATGDGRVALVYELLEGEPLDRVLARRRLAPPEALDLARDVAAGLDALHDAGLVHRDLKPANVMVEPGGRARLLDFGLLRQEEGGTLTAEGMVLGTPAYLAPECFGPSRAGAPADVYAFACLVFELLSGTPPFTGDLTSLVRAHAKEPPPRLGTLRSGLPSGVDGVLGRGLAKDPAARPARAGELVAALESLEWTPRGSGEATVVGTVEVPRGATREGPAPAVPVERLAGPGSAPPPSAPAGRRALALAGGLAIALGVAALVATDGGEPPGPPPPEPSPEAAPDGPFPPDFPDRVRDAFEAARWSWVGPDGARVHAVPAGADPDDYRQLAGGDPLLWSRLLDELDPVERFEAWVAEGGRPEELPAPLREGLEAVDEVFAREGLGRPFHPYLEARPASEPVHPGDHLHWKLPADELERLPRSVSGWWGRAVVEAGRYLALHQEIEELLHAAGPATVFDSNAPTLVISMGAVGPQWCVEQSWPAGPRVRRKVWDVLLPLEDITRRFLYSAGRSLRDEPATADDAARMLEALLGHMTVGLAGTFLDRGPGAYLGGHPVTAQAWLLVAKAEQQRAGIHATLPRPLGPDADTRLALWRRAGATEPPTAGSGWRVRRSHVGALDALLDTGSDEALVATFRRLAPVLDGWPRSERAAVLSRVAWEATKASDALGLTGEELAQLHRGLTDLGELLPAHRRDDLPGVLADLEAAARVRGASP